MQKNTADWHRADVVAALKKAGWSVRALSIASGLGERQKEPREGSEIEPET